MTATERSPGAIGTVARALAAALIMGLALAVATWAGALLGLAASPDRPLLARLAVAGTVTTVVVVALIALLCLRGDRTPLKSIGLTGTGSDVRGFLLMYYLTLTVFGLMLIYARDSTASATIWTCVGAHLAWLTVNRIALGQAGGVQVELGEIATFVFFAVYVTACICAFSILRTTSRASGRRTRPSPTASTSARRNGRRPGSPNPPPPRP